MKKKGNITPIGEIVKEVFSRIEKEKDLSQESIEGMWKTAVGDAGSRHSKPATLKKNVLTVRVDSPAWMQELTLQKRKILKGLKRSLGKDRISEIHFKIGEN